jgi:hypothetical protein
MLQICFLSRISEGTHQQVGGILAAAKARLYHSETGLHQEDEGGTDYDPDIIYGNARAFAERLNPGRVSRQGDITGYKSHKPGENEYQTTLTQPVKNPATFWFSG